MAQIPNFFFKLDQEHVEIIKKKIIIIIVNVLFARKNDLISLLFQPH